MPLAVIMPSPVIQTRRGARGLMLGARPDAWWPACDRRSVARKSGRSQRASRPEDRSGRLKTCSIVTALVGCRHAADMPRHVHVARCTAHVVEDMQVRRVGRIRPLLCGPADRRRADRTDARRPSWRGAALHRVTQRSHFDSEATFRAIDPGERPIRRRAPAPRRRRCRSRSSREQPRHEARIKHGRGRSLIRQGRGECRPQRAVAVEPADGAAG